MTIANKDLRAESPTAQSPSPPTIPAPANQSPGSGSSSRNPPSAHPVRYGKYVDSLGHTSDGTAVAIFNADGQNTTAIPILSEQFQAHITQKIIELEEEPNLFKTKELTTEMAFAARYKAAEVKCWKRCAPFEKGVEIALYDPADTRIRVLPGTVELVTHGSPTIFLKPPVAQALPIPSASPDLTRLKGYFNNLTADQILLIVAWITYIQCSPKYKGTKYVFLVIQGDQGSGKSWLCRLLQRLIDPSALELQAFPSNSKDLPIIISNCHLVAFDNVRSFSSPVSDLLCTASTGGNISSRALYTNDTLHLLPLHGAFILNGIHGFVVQSDLAQRCLTIRTLPIDGQQRIPEAELLKNFERDLPDIFAGLLDLSSKIMAQLPNAIVTHPERMIEFSQWIAAMELALGLPQGEVQASYSRILNESQLDTLLDNSLASAVIKFVSEQLDQRWRGTPAALLKELEEGRSPRELNSQDWPRNPIQLSKRMKSLKASLDSQGVKVEITRGKTRQIIITNVGDLDTSEIY